MRLKLGLFLALAGVMVSCLCYAKMNSSRATSQKLGLLLQQFLDEALALRSTEQMKIISETYKCSTVKFRPSEFIPYEFFSAEFGHSFLVNIPRDAKSMSVTRLEKETSLQIFGHNYSLSIQSQGLYLFSIALADLQVKSDRYSTTIYNDTFIKGLEDLLVSSGIGKDLAKKKIAEQRDKLLAMEDEDLLKTIAAADKSLLEAKSDLNSLISLCLQIFCKSSIFGGDFGDIISFEVDNLSVYLWPTVITGPERCTYALFAYDNSSSLFFQGDLTLETDTPEDSRVPIVYKIFKKNSRRELEKKKARDEADKFIEKIEALRQPASP